MARTDDAALTVALAGFNEGIRLQKAEKRAKKAISKADRAKQEAADNLKKLQSNSEASAEDKAVADEAYRAAVDEWNRIRSGDPDPEAKPDGEESEPETQTADDAAATDAETSDAQEPEADSPTEDPPDQSEAEPEPSSDAEPEPSSDAEPEPSSDAEPEPSSDESEPEPEATAGAEA